MKKIALILAIFISVCSCKKNVTCTCTKTSQDASGTTEVVYTISPANTTAKQAKKGVCASYKTQVAGEMYPEYVTCKVQ